MLTIDKTSRTPIYEQLIEGITKNILVGLLKEGQQLPSIRELAVSLPANPNTVQKAYIELETRGIIQMKQGKGCFVADNAFSVLNKNSRNKLSELKILATELALSGIPLNETQEIIKEAYDKITKE